MIELSNTVSNSLVATEKTYDGLPTHSYCIIEFLHLEKAYPLDRVAEVLRPFVFGDFQSLNDERVNSLIASWDGIEVIVALPKLEPYTEKRLDESVDESIASFTESDSKMYVTVAIKEDSSKSRDRGYWHQEFGPNLAQILAEKLGCQVLHSKSWELDLPSTTLWNRRSYPLGVPEVAKEIPAEPEVYPSGWKRHALITTVDSLRPKYQGPLDFMFVVHPRCSADRAKPFPLARGIPNDRFDSIQPPCTVISRLEVELEGRILRGELVGIPQPPLEMYLQLSESRECLYRIMEYAAHRNTKMVGLGALIPSISKQGRLLKQSRFGVSVTTGHGFTAITIANMVKLIEDRVGNNGVVAIMGAAGSTGRAAIRCMIQQSPNRRLLCIDLPEKLCEIPRIPGWNPSFHRLTSLKQDIKEAAIVVCVTNAVGSILCADDFGPNTIVLDDAQPENVDSSILLERPDVKVIKCLANIPGLRCPFDLGLFAPEHRDEQINFTCLAETILLAANDQSDSFIVGDPTDEQFRHLESLARRYRVEPASFYSFSEVGKIDL